MVADLLIASCAAGSRVHRRASLPAVSSAGRSPHGSRPQTSGCNGTNAHGNRPRTSPETSEVRAQTSRTKGGSRSASNSAVSRGSARPRSVGSAVFDRLGYGGLNENTVVQGTGRSDLWIRDEDGKKQGTSADGRQRSVRLSAQSRTIVTPVYENLFDFGPRGGDVDIGTGDGGNSGLGGGGGANAWDFAEVIMYKQMAAKTAELKKVAIASVPEPVNEEAVCEIEQYVAPEQEISEEETGASAENVEAFSSHSHSSTRNIDDADHVAELDQEDSGVLRRSSTGEAEERRELPSQKQSMASLEILQFLPDPALTPKEIAVSMSISSLGRESQRLSFSHATLSEPIRLDSAGEGLSELDMGTSESVPVKQEREDDHELSTPSKVASTEQLEILPSSTLTKSGSRSEFDAGYAEYEAELQRQDRALQLEAEETRRREREEAHKKARAQSAMRRNLLIFEKITDAGKTKTDGSDRVNEFVYSITESDISLTRAERNMVRLQSTMNVNGLLQASHNRQVADMRHERLMSAREVVAFAHIEEELGRLAARETRRRQMRAFQTYGRWPGEVPIDLYVQPHDGYHDYGTSGEAQRHEGRGRPATTQSAFYSTVKVQNRQRQGLPPLSTKSISPAPNLLRRPRTTSLLR